MSDTKEDSKEVRIAVIRGLDDVVSTLAADVASLALKISTVQGIVTSFRTEAVDRLDDQDARLDEVEASVKNHDTLIHQMAATQERVVNAISVVILTTERTEKKVSGIDVNIQEIKDLVRPK